MHYPALGVNSLSGEVSLLKFFGQIKFWVSFLPSWDVSAAENLALSKQPVCPYWASVSDYKVGATADSG